MQERINSNANALELHLSCINPLKWSSWVVYYIDRLELKIYVFSCVCLSIAFEKLLSFQHSNLLFQYIRLTHIHSSVAVWRNRMVIKVLTHLPRCCIFASVNQISIGSDDGLSPISCAKPLS